MATAGVRASDFPQTTTMEADDLIPIIAAPRVTGGTKVISAPNLLRAANLVHVDATNGSDTQGARGSFLAYQTLAVAQAAAQSGDLVVVHPGTYRATGLGKNGVNWHFYPGAKVYRTQSDTANDTAIFDDGPNGANGPVTCVISGFGEFFVDDVSLQQHGVVLGDEENSINPGLVVALYNASTDFVMHHKGTYSSSINSAGAAVFMFYVRNCARAFISGEEIDTIASEQVGGILWITGTLNTHFKRIRCRHTLGNGGTYTLWSSEPAAGAPNDWHCRVDLLEANYSTVYFDGVTGTYRMWLEALEIRSNAVTDGTGINLAAIEVLNGGKLYVNAQKILTKGATGTGLGPIVWQTGGELWLTALKCTAESVANQGAEVGAATLNSPLFVRQTGGSSIYNVLHWEHVGNFSGDGFNITGGTAELRNGTANVNNGKGFKHGGGTSRLHQLRIVTSNTNSSANSPVYLTANGCTLDFCTLIAPAAANSSDADSATKNLQVTIVFSNKAYNNVKITVVGAGLYTDDPAVT